MICGILKTSDRTYISCNIRCCTQVDLLYIYFGEVCLDGANGLVSAPVRDALKADCGLLLGTISVI